MVNIGGVIVFNSVCHVGWFVSDSVGEWFVCAVVWLLVFSAGGSCVVCVLLLCVL